MNMYYNTILQLLAALTNVVGTTYAILSVLKLKPKELYQALTLEGMDRSDDSLLTQKKQARIGISLVIYAWMLQVLFSFWTITNTAVFIWCLVAYLALTFALCSILFLINKRFENRYYELKKEWDKENPNKHGDLHTYGEF
jgi:hypothetical protein